MIRITITLIVLAITAMLSNAKPKIDSILNSDADYKECVGLLRKEGKQSLLKALNDLTNSEYKVKILNGLCWKEFISNPAEALDFAKQQLKLTKEIDFKEGLIPSYDNLGYLYNDRGEYSLALKYMIEGLKGKESVQDSLGMSISIAGIGNVYYHLKNYPQTLEYWLRAFELDSLLGRKREQALLVANIGLIYVKLKQPIKALGYYYKTLSLYKEIGENPATTYSNIGLIFSEKGDYKKALYYYNEALPLYEELNDLSGLSTIYSNLAEIMSVDGNYNTAINYAEKALEFANRGENKKNTIIAYEILSEIHVKRLNLKSALKFLGLAYALKDSVFSTNMSEQIAEMQTKYETEKKERENQILIQEKELRILKDKEEIERQKKEAAYRNRRDNIQYSVILISLLLLFGTITFLGFIQVSQKMAEGIIFFSFLILFEFLLVLADPFIDEFSKGAPVYKLLFNACIAALIFPAHAFFESTLKSKLLKNETRKFKAKS